MIYSFTLLFAIQPSASEGQKSWPFPPFPLGAMLRVSTWNAIPVSALAVGAMVTSSDVFISMLPPLFLLGCPTEELVVGSSYYLRYAKGGFDLIFRCVDDVQVVKVELQKIPFEIRAGVSPTVRADMQRLKGDWKSEVQQAEGDRRHHLLWPRPEDMENLLFFRGEFLTIYGGGIAPTVCYEIDLSHNPRRIRFFLPDPEDDKSWWKLGKNAKNVMPRYAIYKFEGNRLTIKWGKEADLRDFTPGAEASVCHFKKVWVPDFRVPLN
jgi:hypothetical protein